MVIELTGLYGLDFTLRLHHTRVALMVANPRAARHFAQAMMERSKSDRIDLGGLRQFAARTPFLAWRSPWCLDTAQKRSAWQRAALIPLAIPGGWE